MNEAQFPNDKDIKNPYINIHTDTKFCGELGPDGIVPVKDEPIDGMPILKKLSIIAEKLIPDPVVLDGTNEAALYIRASYADENKYVEAGTLLDIIIDKLEELDSCKKECESRGDSREVRDGEW